MRRGRLEVTIREVPGGAAASRYPKYVSMRHNRIRLGKTNRTFHCRFNFTAPPLDNASVDDVLQVRPLSHPHTHGGGSLATMLRCM